MAPSERDLMQGRLRVVVEETIRRGIRLTRGTGRAIRISKTGRGTGTDIGEFDPDTQEGRDRLEKFLAGRRLGYTFLNLGAPSERAAVNWRVLNLPLHRRLFNILMTLLVSCIKGCPFKDRLYRLMGVRVGKDVEIMQTAWLDHFRPELISIGDGTLVGAFAKLSVHAYEGGGRYRVGIVEIGRNCLLASGVAMGAIRIEDDVRVMPNTTLSPYFSRIRSGSVVGGAPPKVLDRQPSKK